MLRVTAVPAELVTRKVVALTPVTASLKVAVMLLLVATLVAFTAGVRPVMDGPASVVKFQVVAVIGLPCQVRDALVNRTV